LREEPAGGIGLKSLLPAHMAVVDTFGLCHSNLPPAQAPSSCGDPLPAPALRWILDVTAAPGFRIFKGPFLSVGTALGILPVGGG
jgi:hypothetical protein